MSADKKTMSRSLDHGEKFYRFSKLFEKRNKQRKKKNFELYFRSPFTIGEICFKVSEEKLSILLLRYDQRWYTLRRSTQKRRNMAGRGVINTQNRKNS